MFLKSAVRQHISLVRRIFLIVIVVILFLTQIIQAVQLPSYGAWGIFHYFLGAKYVREIGYFNLYSCVYEADRSAWNGMNIARDLHTYTPVSIDRLAPCPWGNFTKSRREAFVTDTAFLMKHADKGFWASVIADKGFNAPPSWAALTGGIANIVPVRGNAWVYLVLFNLDLLFVLIAGLLVWYELGSMAGILTLFLTFLYFGTFGIIGGNYMQFAWYPFVVGAVVAWRKGRYALSGVCIGIAAGLQAFPLVFGIPVLFQLFISLIRREKKMIAYSSYFLVSCLAILTVCFVWGSVYAGRVDIWREWYSKIGIHGSYIKGEIYNIGFTNLAGLILVRGSESPDDYGSYYKNTLARNLALSQNAVVVDGLILFGVVGVLYVMWRWRRKDPLVYGYFFLYLLFSLSPYYYLVLALLPFMFWKHQVLVRRYVVFGIFILFVLFHVLFSSTFYSVSNFYEMQFISKVLVFGYLAGLLGILLRELGDSSVKP